jgi:hypothetical protein
VHPAIPDVPSDPENEIPTGLVYHPLLSGPRAAAPATPDGGTLSILTGFVVMLDEPPALDAEHVRVSPFDVIGEGLMHSEPAE